MLIKLIDRFAVKNTHNFIAFEAVKLLDDAWRRVYLKHFDDLLEGSKDPDKKFKDWNNHIFHPPKYGGAPKAVEDTLAQMIKSLKKGDYRRFVYLSGVVSHYVADVLHPLHTGQTDEETKVHKFHEFGVSVSISGYRKLIKPEKPRVVRDPKSFVISLAEYSHRHYFDVIDNYDPSKGFQFRWDLGINEKLHKLNIELLSRAIWAVASIYQTAIKESRVKPPKVGLSLKTLIAMLKVPAYIISRWLEWRYMKKVTKRMLKEYREKGRILDSLPPDDKGLVQLFMEMKKKSILKMGRPQKETKKEETLEPPEETKKKKGIKARYLSLDAPVEDAPEIGRRTGEKLRGIGITTIRDLLSQDPKIIAEKLGDKRITEETIKRWQIETKLMTEIPNLRVGEAVYLYHVGIHSKEEFEKTPTSEIMRRIEEFLKTEKGRSIEQHYKPPTKEKLEKIKHILKEANP